MKNYWKPVEYRDGTLFDLLATSAEQYPDQFAYEFMGKKVTYRAFLEEIDCAAAALSALGTKEDEIVCIAMPNVPQALIFFYAANRIGAVVNMIHPLSSSLEIMHFVNRVHAETILVMDQFYPAVKEIRGQTGLKNVIVAGVKEALPAIKKLPYSLTLGRKIPKVGKDEDVIFFSDFMKTGKGVSPILPASDRTYKPAVILHSGGTTGKTKGVCHSNYAVNSAVLQMEASGNYLPKEKMLTIMPIFHGNGLAIGVHLILRFGGCCVLIPRFSPHSYVHELLKHKCNYSSGVPTLFEKIIEVPEMKKADLSFLRGLFCGADSLTVELQSKINAFLQAHNADVTIRQGYGMTEGVVATTLTPATEQKDGSIGVPLPDVTVKIVEPGTDRELSTGEIGEIAFSSVTNMMYYYDDEEETEITMKTHSDGKRYVHSGDLGYVDEDGFVFFKGRIKRMIVTNGYNVFPLELENTIQKHPAVGRCCVVGVPDPERIEKVVAFIILNPDIPATDEMKQKLISHFRKNIARYAVPRDIVFTDAFPATKVGKINYSELINRYTDAEPTSAVVTNA